MDWEGIKMTEWKHGEILHELLNVGEAMLANGAEIKRVEDTLDRMGKAYGAVRMNVFAITSSMYVTMEFQDGDEVTQTRRILKPAGTNFRVLEDLNELSRNTCRHPVSPQMLQKQVKEILADQKDRMLKIYLGSILGTASFAVFFGGTYWDGIAAAFFSILICLMQHYLDPVCTNKVAFNVICSFLIGICICLLAKICPVLNADKVIIGDIMLLIPGIPLTNSVKDVLVGDTISGIMRLVEALLWAGALACGFMFAILIAG